MTNLVHLHRVEQARPCINGKRFVLELSDDEINKLAKDEMVYVTSFQWTNWDGRLAFFGGQIVARSWEHAQQLADERKLGEVVEGILCEQGKL